MRKLPSRWQDWMVLVLGTWLLLSPLFLPTDALAASNAKLVGLAFVFFATLAIIEPHVWEGWLSLVCAAWLVVSPFVVGFADHEPAAWNAILTGLVADGIMLRIVTGAGAHAQRA